MINDGDKYDQPFGGNLGAEFQRVWTAIKTNQIVPSVGMKVSKTTGGTTLNPKIAAGDETVVQGGDIVIQTSPTNFSAMGFGDYLGGGLFSYWPDELWYTDFHRRTIAKPPIAERDYDSLDISTQVAELFWGANQPHPSSGFYPRATSQAYAYPHPEKVKTNLGSPGSPSSTGWRLSGDQKDGAPVFIVKIDPPLEIYLVPAALGGMEGQKAGYATGSVASRHPGFDEIFGQHRVSRFGKPAIKCHYLDMNLEGRFWTRL